MTKIHEDTQKPSQALIQHLWALPVNTNKTPPFWKNNSEHGCPEATHGAFDSYDTSGHLNIIHLEPDGFNLQLNPTN